MKRRENMDYRKLSALLGALEDASLSAEEERELEACVSDSDYEIMAADADAFTSTLAAVIAVAAWLFMPDYGTENATRMATVETVKPAESVKIQDDYTGNAPAPVQHSVMPRKAYAHTQTRVAAEQQEDAAPADPEDAWATFFAMREEMADVVSPGHETDIPNEITIVVSPEVLDDGQEMSIDVYGSLKDASEILNSILCEL